MSRLTPDEQLGYELARTIDLMMRREWRGVEYHLERALSCASERVSHLTMEERAAEDQERARAVARRSLGVPA